MEIHSHVWLDTATTLSAIYGKESGWVCIDIDDEGIMSYSHKGLYEFLKKEKNKTLCVRGQKGYKYIFRTTQTSPLWSLEPTVKADGFEIIPRACIAGAYSSGGKGEPNKSYKYEMDKKKGPFLLEIPCPIVLNNGLLTEKSPINSRKKRRLGTPDESGVEVLKEVKLLKEDLPAVIDTLKTTYNFNFTLKDGSDCVYTSPCLYKDASDPTKVLLSLNEERGEFKFICAHESCREKYLPFFLEALGLIKQLSFRLEEENLFIQLNDFESVYKASKDSDKAVLLKSPTGTGRTKSATVNALNLVLEDPARNHTCSNFSIRETGQGGYAWAPEYDQG